MNVLISIKPKHFAKIARGEKRLDLRKTLPTQNLPFEKPFTVYLYVSGTGEVRGEFLCDGFIVSDPNDVVAALACVSRAELMQYCSRGGRINGWGIGRTRIYKHAKRLSDFGLVRPPQSWQYTRRVPERDD